MKSNPGGRSGGGSGRRGALFAAAAAAALVGSALGAVLYLQAQDCRTKSIERIDSLEALDGMLERIALRTAVPATADQAAALRAKLAETRANASRAATCTADAAALREDLAASRSREEASNKGLADAKEQLRKSEAQREKDAEAATAVRATLDKELSLLRQMVAADNEEEAEDSDAALPADEVAAARLRVLQLSGAQCTPVPDYEFGGDPILLWGYEHRAADVAECCAACHAHRRGAERGTEHAVAGTLCNMWSFCANEVRCAAVGAPFLQQADLHVPCLSLACPLPVPCLYPTYLYGKACSICAPAAPALPSLTIPTGALW